MLKSVRTRRYLSRQCYSSASQMTSFIYKFSSIAREVGSLR